MKKYVISVWNSYATLCIENEGDDTLEYSLVDIPENLYQAVQDYIDSQVDLTESIVYPVTEEALKGLKEIGLDL